MNVSIDCRDFNLSDDSLTLDYWKSGSINNEYHRIGIAIGTIMLIFFLLGLPGNVLIIFSIVHQQLCQQPTMLLLLNLAVADLLACIIVIPPTIITGLTGEYIFGQSDATRCKVCQTGIFIILLILVNLHMLSFLSLDRYILIKYPMKYQTVVTIRRTLAAIAFVWLVSILLSVPPFFGFGSVYYDHPTFTCTARFEGSTDVTDNIFYLVLVLIEGMIPLAVIIVTNIGILIIAHRHIKQVYTRKNTETNDEYFKYRSSIKERLMSKKSKKQLQLLRVFGTILVSNIITWIPLIIRIIEASITSSDNPSLWSNFILIISVNSHSVMHPFIQVSLIPEIRDYIMSLFKKCHPHKDSITTKWPSEVGCCLSNCKLTALQNCLEALNTTVLPLNENTTHPS